MTTEPVTSAGVADQATYKRKVLLVADEEFRAPELRTELKEHLSGYTDGVDVFVVAPALARSALEHELAAVDGGIEDATIRLEAILSRLRRAGFEATGRVGDGDPVVAIGDGLREFEADEIVVIAHEEKERAYAEKDLWKKIRHEFHPPLVELVVGRPGTDGEVAGVLGIQRDAGRQVTEQEMIEETRNFPPMPKRVIAGIVLGLLGTFALGLIALVAGTNDDGNISGPAAAILLLAIGAFLINIAHTISLLFMGSVNYTGIWEKFMARLATIYTLGALVASLILLTMT